MNNFLTEIITTIVPVVKMNVPRLYFLDVTPTSALITWSSNNLHQPFQINYGQKMKISLKNEGRYVSKHSTFCRL